MNARKAKRIRCNRPHHAAVGSETLYRNAKIVGGTAQVIAHGHAVRPTTTAIMVPFRGSTPRRTVRRP